MRNSDGHARREKFRPESRLLQNHLRHRSRRRTRDVELSAVSDLAGQSDRVVHPGRKSRTAGHRTARTAPAGRSTRGRGHAEFYENGETNRDALAVASREISPTNRNRA